jgi:hypothetical protein
MVEAEASAPMLLPDAQAGDRRVGRDQLRSVVTIKIDRGDPQERPCIANQLDRPRGRQPYMEEGGILTVDRDPVVTAIAVEVCRQQAFRRAGTGREGDGGREREPESTAQEVGEGHARLQVYDEVRHLLDNGRVSGY